MTSPKVPEENAQEPTKASELQNSVQTTDAGDMDLTATASLGESAAASTGAWPGTTTPEPTLPMGKKEGLEHFPGHLVVDAFPRIVSATDIVEAFEDALAFCEPLLDSEESALSLLSTLQEWGLGVEEEGPRPRKNRRHDEAAKRGLSNLIAPPGELEGDSQKFICVFQVGLEDDEEFCLVKRILGKAGNNMRRIADECNAKVRLRGIGSGFLEGSDGTEANMPLQLNVSCTDYSDYVNAVDHVSHLLKDLYKHYRRYARSKGMEPPDVRLSVEEVRRDDLQLDQFAAKANRTDKERERDRKEREAERRERAMAAGTTGGQGRYASFQRLDNGTSSDSESSVGPLGGHGGGHGWSNYGGRSNYSSHGGTVDDEWRTRTLPSGAPMPTTPAGRRAAARTGGAAAAAAVSAAAREAEREERERMRLEKERKRREAEAKATALAKRPSRHAPRGMGMVFRSAGDAQQMHPDGQLPIGANTASPLQPPIPKGDGKKGDGKGKPARKRGGKGRKGKGKGDDDEDQ